MDLSAPSGTGSSSSTLIGIYYDKVLLENLYPNMRFYQLAKKKKIPKGISTTITFSKITRMSGSLTQLTEGVPPSPTWLTSTQITDTLVQLGAYTPVSDVLEMAALDPVLEDVAKELGFAAANSVDRYIYGRCFGDDASQADAESTGILGGITVDWSNFYMQHPTAVDQGFSTVFFCTNGSKILTGAALKSFITSIQASATADEQKLTVNRILMAVNDLRSSNVPAYPDGTYAMVVHPACITDLMRDPDFEAWMSPQMAKETIYKGEVAQIGGVRMLTSTNIAKIRSCSLSSNGEFSGFSGVFNVILGPDAIAVTELDGHIKMKVKVAGSAGAVDPLDQVSTVGYKWTGCAKVIDEARGKILMVLTKN